MHCVVVTCDAALHRSETQRKPAQRIGFERASSVMYTDNECDDVVASKTSFAARIFIYLLMCTGYS